MKICKGRLLLQELHFERLLSSLKLLRIQTDDSFTKETLVGNIIELCRQNSCSNSARIRLAVFRKGDNTTGYSIEAIPLSETTNDWNEDGLNIALYPHGRKAIDAFANLKSANFLVYVLAGRYAIENSLDDCLVLNVHKNF